MNLVPQPDPEDVALNAPFTVELDPAEEAEITFTPEQSGTTFYLATVAISKFKDTIYEIQADNAGMFGPANIPPTDIDDFGVTWVPCKQFSTKLNVTITNLSGSVREYHIQPVGFERSEGGA